VALRLSDVAFQFKDPHQHGAGVRGLLLGFIAKKRRLLGPTAVSAIDAVDGSSTGTCVP
jgi:hypothetical protein